MLWFHVIIIAIIDCCCVWFGEPKKFGTLLDLCVSSLRRGHANLLCIVPILTEDPRRESKNPFYNHTFKLCKHPPMQPHAHCHMQPYAATQNFTKPHTHNSTHTTTHTTTQATTQAAATHTTMHTTMHTTATAHTITNTTISTHPTQQSTQHKLPSSHHPTTTDYHTRHHHGPDTFKQPSTDTHTHTNTAQTNSLHQKNSPPAGGYCFKKENTCFPMGRPHPPPPISELLHRGRGGGRQQQRPVPCFL